QLIIDPAPVPTPVTSLTLNKTQLPLFVGETQTLTATLLPAEVPDKGITWSSSDSSIVQVSPTGQLKALAEGTATITVTSTQDPSFTAQCIVIVLDVPTEGIIAPTADSFVRNGASGNDNYGTIPYLYIKNDASGYARKAYIKFDTSLLPGSGFDFAKLRLYVTTADGYAQRTVSVYATSSDWTESGIKWNNGPASASLVGQIPVPNGSLGSWVILDLTDYMLAHRNDGFVSFVLTNDQSGSTPSNIQFGSKESANGPQLIVN
ncbi:MAG: hypothetical protein K0Q73_8217, partial [Paenibacillus sp.]|nr:hypothetical protein [Paenibacillus sp.]